MDERFRETARLEVGETPGKIGDQRIERVERSPVELGADVDTTDELRGGACERGRAPVGQTRPPRARRSDRRSSPGAPRAGRPSRSAAGSSASNRPSPGTSSRSTVCVAGSDASSGGHQVRGGGADHREDRTLVSHEPRHALGPCRGRGGREAQQQREVPRLHLHGRARCGDGRARAGTGPPMRASRRRRPAAPTASGADRPDRPRRDRPARSSELRAARSPTSSARYVTSPPLHDALAASAAEVGARRSGRRSAASAAVHDLPDLRPPRFVDRERLERPEHLAGSRAQDEPNDRGTVRPQPSTRVLSPRAPRSRSRCRARARPSRCRRVRPRPCRGSRSAGCRA